MFERSPATVMPVLGGLDPGVTVTVKSVPLPGETEDGLAAPVPVGLAVTLRAIFALPPRDCSSVMVVGSVLGPEVVPDETVALKEKILSPATASPLAPVSLKACATDPP